MESKKTILIIEDEPLVLHALKDALQSAGDFIVSEAKDGGTALQLIQEFHPDLALVDIDIPVMDGVTLAKEMAAKKLIDRTKIMFLTNAGDLPTISAATGIEGVLGYFLKIDWDIKDVIAEITAKLKEQDAEKTRAEERQKLFQAQAESLGTQIPPQ